MDQSFDLPENLSAYATGKYIGENYQLIVEDNTIYVWLIQPMIPMKREFAFVARGVPGNLPVSCCATQWSESSGSPIIIGEAKVYLRAIERAANMVRVSVEQHGFTPLDIAVGIIIPR